MLTPPAAISSMNCTCDEVRGYINSSAHQGKESNALCVRRTQFVSVKDAEAVSVTISSIVVSAVVANVAVAVATSVASAMGGGIGAGMLGAEAGVIEGAAAGSSTVQMSTSGTMNLVTQVQFLHILGRLPNTSESLQAFSEGFGWANLDLPPGAARAVFPWRNETRGRRAQKKSKQSDGAQGAAVNASIAGPEEEAVCSLTWLMLPAEKLFACASLMICVFLLRNLAFLCIKYGFKATPSATFWFPGCRLLCL